MEHACEVVNDVAIDAVDYAFVVVDIFEEDGCEGVSQCAVWRERSWEREMLDGYRWFAVALVMEKRRRGRE